MKFAQFGNGGELISTRFSFDDKLIIPIMILVFDAVGKCLKSIEEQGMYPAIFESTTTRALRDREILSLRRLTS